MRIRGKLLVLLLAITLLPLLFLSFSHVRNMQDLGRELGGRSRDALTTRAQAELVRLVEQHARTVRGRAQYLELVLEVQQEWVESVLGDPPPASPRVRLAGDIDLDGPLPPDFHPSEMHVRTDAAGKRHAVPITLERQIFVLAPDVDRETVAGELARLSRLDEVMPFLHDASRGLVYWHFTALENGLHTVYPGHAGYPPDYDPRTRRWYRDAVAADGLILSDPYVEVSTGRIALTLARPIHRRDGTLVGVTGIDVLVSQIASDVRPPSGLSERGTAMLVLPLAPKPGAEPRLAVVARPGPARAGSWREPLEREWVASDDPAGVAAMTRDLLAGRIGTRIMGWRGEEGVWAYGPLGGGQISSLVLVVPRADVVAEALAVEASALTYTAGEVETAGLFVAAATIAVMLVALLASRGLTRPLQRLVEAARALGQGDFSARADVRGRDELGELGHTFNDMVVQLEEHVHLRHSLELAREVQQHLLPSGPPRLDGLDVAGTSLYCDETGGDYFDFLQLTRVGPNLLGVAVGDVTGHGIAAAMLMTTGRALLRSQAFATGALGEVIDRVNRLLSRDTSGGRFMTLCYLVVDARARNVRWVSAGHDAALLYDPESDRWSELEGEDIPLGIDPDWRFRESGPRSLAEGQLLFVGTDGIWEARAPDGAMFGKQRLREVLRAHAGESAESVCGAVTAAVAEFEAGAPRRDDVTLVVLKVTGRGTGAQAPSA